MELDILKPNGSEFDICAVCGDDGDNTNLTPVKNTDKFICVSCEYNLRYAYDTIKEIESKY